MSIGGHRIVGLLTNTSPVGLGRQLPDLELRHWPTPRIEDRIRAARRLVYAIFHSTAWHNRIWLVIAALAVDLLTRTSDSSPDRSRRQLRTPTTTTVHPDRRPGRPPHPQNRPRLAWPWATTTHAPDSAYHITSNITTNPSTTRRP